MRDVAYHLILSCDGADLARNERAYVEVYLKRLAAKGQSLAFADAWREYRLHAALGADGPRHLGGRVGASATTRRRGRRGSRWVGRRRPWSASTRGAPAPRWIAAIATNIVFCAVAIDSSVRSAGLSLRRGEKEVLALDGQERVESLDASEPTAERDREQPPADGTSNSNNDALRRWRVRGDGVRPRRRSGASVALLLAARRGDHPRARIRAQINPSPRRREHGRGEYRRRAFPSSRRRGRGNEARPRRRPPRALSASRARHSGRAVRACARVVQRSRAASTGRSACALRGRAAFCVFLRGNVTPCPAQQQNGFSQRAAASRLSRGRPPRLYLAAPRHVAPFWQATYAAATSSWPGDLGAFVQHIPRADAHAVQAAARRTAGVLAVRRRH